MKLVKKLAAFLLSSVLCVTSSFCAFSAPATASEWATPSVFPSHNIQNAVDSVLGVVSSDNGFTTLAVASNTVRVYAGVHNSSGWVRNVPGTYVRTNSDGFSYYTWPLLTNSDEYYREIYYSIPSNQLPSPGTYGFTYSFQQAEISFDVKDAWIAIWASGSNITNSSNGQIFDYSYASGRFTSSCNLSIGYAQDIYVNAQMTIDGHLNAIDILVPKTPFTFTYKVNSGDGTVSSPDIDAGISGDDALININQGISNSVSSIDDSIKELIQTIINQLDALWNQFAGEFTNMFAAWQAHTNAIVAAIQAIGIQAGDGIQNIIDAGHNDADQIQENQDKNTDTITGGYDNSQITGDNDKLSDSMNQYDQAEDNLMNDVNGAIDDVDFNLDLTSFSSIIQTVSGFLQSCYENSGNFKIVINLSLLVSLASCVIGLYRFKGGG